VSVGEVITSYSSIFHKDVLVLNKTLAECVHDWYMLSVTLAVEVCKDNWKEQLVDEDIHPRRVSDAKLQKVFAGVRHSELQDFLWKIHEKSRV
jgi:hypothetical protein